MDPLRLDCIRDDRGFQSLAEDWNRLARDTNPRSVFLRHEWFDAAWCWLRRSAELCIVCVRRGDELVGICPFVLRRTKRSGIPLSALEFLTIPDTQEAALLAAPADARAVADALCGYLAGGDLAWDVADLQKLQAGSVGLEALRSAAAASGFSVRVTEAGSNPGLGLRDGWEAYYGRRSRRLKKGNNHAANRIKRDGREVTIRCYDSSNREDYDRGALLETLANLSGRSWKADTGLTLDNPEPRAFIERLTAHADENGWLLAWLLSIDGTPAAMEYQLEYEGVVSGLRADYDQRYDDLSPGTLLNWRIIERLFDRDATYYSLGPGSNAYKMRWSEHDEMLFSVLVYSKSLRGRLLFGIDAVLRPAARRLRSIFRSPQSSDK